MSDDDGEGVCRIAFESALKKAGSMCDDPDALQEATKPFFGIERGGDTDCKSVLVTGITPKSSISETREWVHCRANKLVREDDVSIEDAISKAWDEAEDETADDLPAYDDLFGDNANDNLGGGGGDGFDDVDMGLRDPDLDIEDTIAED